MKFYNNIIIICGPTASGKSQIALELCKRVLKGVIINADSIQIYRDIPILTNQPTVKEQAFVPHKLYGLIGGHKRYSVADWLNDVTVEIDKALENNLTPIVVGGSGMYISSLINGIRVIDDVPSDIIKQTEKNILINGIEELYRELLSVDKDTESYIKVNDTHRIIRAYNLYKAFSITPSQYRKLPNKEFYSAEQFKIFSLMPPRKELYENCEERFTQMINDGAIDEMHDLRSQGYNLKSPIAKAIGYKELYNYIDGNMDLEQAINSAKHSTRNYAKRQTTWFTNQLQNIDHMSEDNITGLTANIKKSILVGN